jgi:hypothetical protein
VKLVNDVLIVAVFLIFSWTSSCLYARLILELLQWSDYTVVALFRASNLKLWWSLLKLWIKYLPIAKTVTSMQMVFFFFKQNSIQCIYKHRILGVSDMIESPNILGYYICLPKSLLVFECHGLNLLQSQSTTSAWSPQIVGCHPRKNLLSNNFSREAK